jgi:hypothetical protein
MPLGDNLMMVFPPKNIIVVMKDVQKVVGQAYVQHIIHTIHINMFFCTAFTFKHNVLIILSLDPHLEHEYKIIITNTFSLLPTPLSMSS